MRRTLAMVGICAALAFAGCGGDDEPAGGGTTTQEQTDTGGGAAGGTQPAGKQLFVNTCGGCHTLEDAGTNGQVGPNLTELQPDKQTVLTAIKTGPSVMPENLLQGAD